MATLYTQQEKNIRKTWLLMFLFVVVIIAIGWAFAQTYNNPIILYGCIAFSLIMNIISYWYSDRIVLRMTGAMEATHANNRDLYHIVENLCIAGGLKMPKIYIVEDNALNAFATGRNEENAVIAVTRGLIDKLDKLELEGVIAHELSHIGNRDILLTTIIVVLVGFIAVLSEMFLRDRFFWGGDSSDRKGAGGAAVIIGIVLAILAPIATKIIQLAISRKREYLADASGALLTRYPEGLASALEKISKSPVPLRQASKAASHLFISNPLNKQNRTKLFSTHPPIEERIKALRGIKF